MAEIKFGSSRGPTPFDRLYGPRRNKKIRNVALITAAAAALISVVLMLDAQLSHEPLKTTPLFIFGLISFLSTGMSIYYHMKFLSRD